MDSKLHFKLWTVNTFVLYFISIVWGAQPNLWCLQCTWSNTNTYGGYDNATAANIPGNSTGDPLCENADLSDITVFPKDPLSPIVNPLCTYDPNAYTRLLEGPCYNYACYAQGKSCVKWSTYKGDVLLNITRLCAVVGDEKGCYVENYSGYRREVCICDDQHYCNAGWAVHGHVGWIRSIVLCFSVFTATRFITYEIL